MTKLTNVDAQRVLAVIEDMLEKLGWASHLTPELLQHISNGTNEELIKTFGDDLLRRFQLTMQLERQFESFALQTDGTSMTISEMQQKPDYDDVYKPLKKSVRDLYRKLAENPSAINAIKSMPDGRTHATLRFLNSLSELKDLTLRRLTTTVEEDKARSELLEEYMEKEKQANLDRRNLQKELNHIRREREKAASTRTDLITKLKAELQDLKHWTQQRSAKLEEESQAREEFQRKAFEEKESVLSSQLQKVTDELSGEQKSHKDDEDHLRKRKMKIENEVEQWINKYDRDMDAKVQEVVDIKAMYEEERRKLTELEEHFAKIDAERERISEEQEIIAERQRKHQEKENFRHRMAAKIQAHWKGLVTRRDFEKLKKSKKKKKKAGKKGGKRSKPGSAK
eukprot:GILK01001019.1.p1 GENE.GILK01001019.1~~GILK01001019.1.p1  ORF type:complete len:411 (-),score=115.83 GILK01001019.1:163-1353(-)